MHREALQPQPLLDTVAALGGVAAVIVFLPGLAIVGDFTGQADGAVGVSAEASVGTAPLGEATAVFLSSSWRKGRGRSLKVS